MGQYWKPVNLDKKEFIHPHRLASGLKLWELLANPPGVGAALIILTAAMPEVRGGGDLKPDPIIGRWAGDWNRHCGRLRRRLGPGVRTPRIAHLHPMRGRRIQGHLRRSLPLIEANSSATGWREFKRQAS